MRLWNIILALFLAVMMLTAPLAGQFQSDPKAGQAGPKGDKWFGKKDKKKSDNTRSVYGVVKDPKGKLISGAVVKIKDTKSLKIRSFITLEDGSYRFHGLSKDVDYELKADYQGQTSKTRRLSVFNSREKATINLKLEPKKS